MVLLFYHQEPPLKENYYHQSMRQGKTTVKGMAAVNGAGMHMMTPLRFLCIHAGEREENIDTGSIDCGSEAESLLASLNAFFSLRPKDE